MTRLPRLLPLLLPLALAACATAPDPSRSAGAEPVAVHLYRDTLTARFSDGTLCTAVREGPSGGWVALLSGCPHRWRAEVPDPGRVPRRALGSDPAGQIVLRGPEGREYRFAPQPAPGV